MILGMNVLEFSIAGWLFCIVVAWLCDFGPEIYREQKEKWGESRFGRTPRTEFAGTLRIRESHHEFPVVFVISKPSTAKTRGRHAKV